MIHIFPTLLGMSVEGFVVLKTFCIPIGMYDISVRHPFQQIFFTRLDEKFMPSLATGLTFLVD